MLLSLKTYSNDEAELPHSVVTFIDYGNLKANEIVDQYKHIYFEAKVVLMDTIKSDQHHDFVHHYNHVQQFVVIIDDN